GYGFLSESPQLAEACAEAGLTFVGPSADAMRQLGLKDEAKRLAESASVPVVPGYFGNATDKKTLRSEAGKIGYPLMVKAVAGGGGRGMRVVEKPDDLAEALDSAARESGAAFGDSRLMLEKLVQAPRHIEVQVFGDKDGNVVHLFERDCSLQRRHQKVIEEAPAPGMSDGLRKRMTDAAVMLTASVGYAGAGTVEFLVEGGTLADDASFYFIEMNTRLQVEHPVTEEITGLDLVEWQLRVAAGEPLPLKQDAIAMSGHAIEARLYAEDPAEDFQPSVGTVHRFDLPGGEGLRIESGLGAGDIVASFYDPMLAKMIAVGANRKEALGRMDRALSEAVILGVTTNTGFLHALCTHASVQSAAVDTGLIGREIDFLVGQPNAGARDRSAVQAGLEALFARASGPMGQASWDAGDAFQLGPPRQIVRTVIVDGNTAGLALSWEGGRLAIDGAVNDSPPEHTVHVVNTSTALVWSDMHQISVTLEGHAGPADTVRSGDGRIVAPITGRITQVGVKSGAAVANGDRLLTVEAMKMEHVVSADVGGTIETIHVAPGDQVTDGSILITIAPDSEVTA
ncbi:MAG: acetyl/propionyl/methylcrotonyl-CoA carboxylase subunit alpha, partial [Hyphomicrobiaceae bacterium]